MSKKKFESFDNPEYAGLIQQLRDIDIKANPLGCQDVVKIYGQSINVTKRSYKYFKHILDMINSYGFEVAEKAIELDISQIRQLLVLLKAELGK